MVGLKVMANITATNARKGNKDHAPTDRYEQF